MPFYASFRTIFILILHKEKRIVNRILKKFFHFASFVKEFSISHNITFPIYCKVTKVYRRT